MVSLFTSSGFFLYDCDEITFEDSLNKYGYGGGSNMVAWLMPVPQSLDILLTLGINTCFMEIASKEGCIKKDLGSCQDMIRTYLEYNVNSKKSATGVVPGK